MGGIRRVRAGSEFCSRGGHVRHLILHAVVHNSPLKSHPLPALRSHPLPALRSHPLPALKSHPLPALKSHPLPALRSHPLYQRLGPILPVLRPHPLNQRSVPTVSLTSAQIPRVGPIRFLCPHSDLAVSSWPGSRSDTRGGGAPGRRAAVLAAAGLMLAAVLAAAGLMLG